jgi:acetate kinase
MSQNLILCLNSGSSSLKFALYRLGETDEVLLAKGAVENIGLAQGRVWIRGPEDEKLIEVRRHFPTHTEAAAGIVESPRSLGLPSPDAAGHRIVHGGPHHTAPQRVDAVLLADLRQLIPFAPLHMPSAIQGVEAVAARFPGLPQVVCFDTSFHRRMPDVAQRLPLARQFWDQGIRRYGFHGLSYEYIVAALSTAVQGRVIIAHLGNGASLAAVLNGQPVDTTMGFTPIGGLMMGTRSGDLDPGVLIHLVRQNAYDSGQLDGAVNEQAGLLGVSGMSPDMKALLDAREREPRAAQAVELFCYVLRKHIGAMAAALGGLDTLVFTGGIGERAAPVRWEVCEKLAYLGVELAANRNAANAKIISSPASLSTVRVMLTNEDVMIARHTRALLFTSVTTP